MNIMYKGDGLTSFQESFSLSYTNGVISIHSPMLMHSAININVDKITGKQSKEIRCFKEVRNYGLLVM
ncbi:hypothetical protein NGC25_13685 [Enterococcus faecalis]|uniref:hypothetical protein n=1 Tax=Enterococcus faecalis TaxID=1351 RepID=UPI0013869297|nr:hypothetical protein [Enterococcus faecalis]MEB7428322.1 hypothetical protein [Enterococcus faecalis]